VRVRVVSCRVVSCRVCACVCARASLSVPHGWKTAHALATLLGVGASGVKISPGRRMKADCSAVDGSATDVSRPISEERHLRDTKDAVLERVLERRRMVLARSRVLRRDLSLSRRVGALSKSVFHDLAEGHRQRLVGKRTTRWEASGRASGRPNRRLARGWREEGAKLPR
jgi:hypothetical protein